MSICILMNNRPRILECEYAYYLKRCSFLGLKRFFSSCLPQFKIKSRKLLLLRPISHPESLSKSSSDNNASSYLHAFKNDHCNSMAHTCCKKDFVVPPIKPHNVNIESNPFVFGAKSDIIVVRVMICSSAFRITGAQ